MRIVMIGQRGVPATFGGIEHHVEELGSRLVAMGHDVVVYCRSNYVADGRRRYRGMRLRHLPTIPTKHLDAIVQSGLSTGAAMLRPPDIIHYHALGPGIFAPLPRYLARSKVVQTVHGFDDERDKWGRGAKAILRAARVMSARVPDALVAVSEDLASCYDDGSGRRATYIANGVVAPVPRPPGATLSRLGVQLRRYLLFVGRLVPEKSVDLLVRAFSHVPGDLRLVVAGGSSFTDRYVTALEELARSDDRVCLAGYVDRRALEELYTNAAAFVLPSRLEGLPLTLLEAASYRTPVVASDIPPHLQVLEADAPGRRLFRAGSETDLVRALRTVLDDGAPGDAALQGRVLADYSWDRAAQLTEALYRSLLSHRAAARGGAFDGGGRAPVASA